MKKLLALTLAMLMISALLPMNLHKAVAEVETSGQCGDDLYWEFDRESGTLTITGSGAMWDYSSSSDQPWASFRSEITEVELEDGVTSIGDRAFRDCTWLTSITIPDSVTSIGSSAFSGCTSLSEITIGNSVTSIGSSAFSGCTSLSEITIGNGVTSIGGFTFSRCTGLTSITIPDGVTSIGHYAFEYCKRLKSITIPDSVTSIGDFAFQGCTGLQSITIPGSVTSIDGVFYGCTGLKSVRIGIGVTRIGGSAFYGCTGLTSISIPGSVTSIAQYAFSGCTGLKSVMIGNGVTSIGSSAFSGCTGLTSITIPDSVTSIGSSAFSDCTGLQSITIPNGVTSIGANPFSYTAWWNAQNEGLVYLDYILLGVKGKCGQIVRIKEGTRIIAGCVFSNYTLNIKVTVPDSVITIGDYAFRGSGLTEITIPDGVTSIGRYAFSGCTGLQSITIPNGVTSIPEYAFSGCTRLTVITIPDGVTSIAQYAFSGCTGLKSVMIGNGVTSIGRYAFSGCTGLTEITIPDGVTNIPEYAFSNCHGLQEITIPDSVTSIGEKAFYYCTSLSEITIPDGVTSIGRYAFSRCTGLTEITIPDGVTSIPEYAFYGCTGLTDVYYNGTPRMRNNITIEQYNTSLTNAEWHYLKPVSIEMKTLPNKLTYMEGETLDLTGGAITTYYDYEIVEEETITSDMVSGFDSSNVGTQTLTVMFDGQTTTFDVTVSHMSGEPVRENEITPTCTEEGSYDEVVYCTTCGDELSRETIAIPALEHAPGEPVIENEVDPTYTSEGGYDEVVYCTRCGAELERHTHTVDRLPFEGTIEWNAEDVQFKGSTPYVIANGSAQTPRFTVKNTADGSVVDSANYDYEYRENTNAGTGYVFVTFKGDYEGTCRGSFKIYLQPTTTTTVANIKDGIKLTWSKVEGADGYVIYRRAWSSTTNGWTDFVRWNNTTALNWTDTKVYAGTRYQYGVKAYFARRTDPVSGATIGGNVGDNFNLGEVGPLKTTVRITTRTLNSVTAGTKQMTVKWGASSVFTGYQIKYATDNNFTKNVVAIKITDPKTAQTVIKNLKTGQTYYVTVRSYHEFNGMTYFGEWSNVLSCKVK